MAQSQMAEPPGVRHRRLVGPEGTRPHLGALLLGYYTDDGKLIYAGRVGTVMPDKVLADLRRRLEPLLAQHRL
jgi:ATP-dependent DNA ligase